MKIARMVQWTFIIAITLAVAGVIAVAAMWGHRSKHSSLRPEGPFAETFRNLYSYEGAPGSMTEYRSERIEDWFRSVLPRGTETPAWFGEAYYYSNCRQHSGAARVECAKKRAVGSLYNPNSPGSPCKSEAEARAALEVVAPNCARN